MQHRGLGEVPRLKRVQHASLGFVVGAMLVLSRRTVRCLALTPVSPLTNFKSLPVGTITENGDERVLSGPQKGLFLAFQSQAVEWLEDVSKTDPQVGDF